jgi:hypothetical protein
MQIRRPIATRIARGAAASWCVLRCPVSHSALSAVVALFVLFASVSVGFREYFARRWRRNHGVTVRGLRNHVRDLLVPRPAAPRDSINHR